MFAARLPKEELVTTAVPVETKGYNKIVNLPDWLTGHGIFIKSEKSFANGRLFVPEQCPFSSAHRDGACAIQFANGAVFAGCKHTSCGGGIQRWQELRERFEPGRTARQFEQKRAGWRRERARAKADRNGSTDPGPAKGKGYRPAVMPVLLCCIGTGSPRVLRGET